MKRTLLFLLCTLGGVIFFGSSVHAEAGLRVTPTDYTAKLAKGEKQKGVVDVANPDTKNSVHVTVTVAGFRQTGNDGALQVFDDPQVKAGVIPDLSEFDLGPREALRMYFMLDGTKLRSGDTFGTLLFKTAIKNNSTTTGSTVEAAVGSLLVIENGTTGERKAKVAAINIPFFQMNNHLQGSYTVTNTGDEKNASGFFPDVTATVAPLGTPVALPHTLVFAGRSREVPFSVPDGRFGLYNVTVAYGGSSQSKVVLFASPERLIVAGLVLALIGFVVRAVMRNRHRGYFRAKSSRR